MIASWHREHLNNAIRKLDEVVGLIAQLEVLLDTPKALEGFKIQVEPVNCTHHAQVMYLGTRCHTATPYVVS